MLNATSDAISSEPTPAPAMKNTSSKPVCRPRIVALARRTPYDNPCDIDNTAPEPGDTAIMQAATKKVIQVAKLMVIPFNLGNHHCSGIVAPLAWVNIACQTTQGVPRWPVPAC